MDVVLADAVRSPMILTAEGFSDITPMELVGQTVDALIRRNGIDAADVDRLLIQCGTGVNQQLAMDGSLNWPVTALPARVPAITIDRWCGTSQQAMHAAARSITDGSSSTVVLVGVEWTRRHAAARAGAEASPSAHHLKSWISPQRAMAAEWLARAWELDREQLDEYTLRSHQRAGAVSASGEFTQEIVPIYTHDIRDRRSRELLAICDDMIDSNLTIEQLRQIRPIFPIGQQPSDLAWSITAGNTAHRAMGTSAIVLMSDTRAAQLGLSPRARIVGLAAAKGDSTLTLAAPLRATEKVLAANKITLAQLDHVEVDEEFACVPLAWCSEFPVDPDILNPRGGALALGYPRACSSLRQLATMISALKATGGRLGLQTASADNGMGYTTIIECQ